MIIRSLSIRYIPKIPRRGEGLTKDSKTVEGRLEKTDLEASTGKSFT